MKRTKRQLSSFMAMILFASTMTISSVPTVTALAATDTNGHWAESTINKWTASGYISGYPDGTFRPNNAISRAEFVTLANKAFSYNVPTSISFKDLDTSHWAYSEIQKGVSAGYIKGDAAGTFRPGAAVTRQEAAVMMAQIKQLQQNANSALSYTDYNSIANWAKPYVGAVSNVKIMQGFPNGAFRPQTSMTRAEAVTALENAIFAPTQSSNQPSSSVTTPNYNTNTSTNTNSSSNSSNSSNSTSASDYTLEDASLRNRTIDGNLIISSSLGSKDVTLNNVTVKGTVKIQGGSTIKAQSCDFSKVEMDKSGVTLNASNNTKIRNLEYLQRGKIEGSGYENVYVQDSSLSEATVDATVKYLELDTDANLKLYKNADVATLEVTSDAKDGEVTFTSGAEVDDMTIRGRIRIYGKGDINDMTTYVSGIRYSIKPDRVTTRGDGEKPSYSSGESGSSSSSSGSDYDDLTLDREDRKYDADGERYHNVSIEADGVTLRDAIVYNRLTITRDVEDGEVILDDVRVRGDVYIYGGGENSVIFRNCDIQGDIISYKDTDDSRYGDEPVALEFEDDTDVDGDIKVRGDTIIRAESDIKLGNVIVDRELNEDLIVDAKINTLKLVADCDVKITGRSRIDKVDINSNRDITLRMESGSYIDTIDSNSDLTIRGNGTVKTIRTSKTVTTDSGIVNDDQTSTFVAVTDIVGIPSTQSSYSLTLSPSVQPTNASYQTVKWRIDGLNTAGASISDDRVVTATKDGQVRLLATIDNGKAIGTAYTKSFTVTFSSGSGTVTPPEPTTSATVKSITKSDTKTSYKENDTIELFANFEEGSTLGTDKVVWESKDTSYVTVTPNSTDSTKATARVLKTDNSGAKHITITAKVGNTKPASIVIKVQAEGTIDTTTTTISGITIAGNNGANVNAAQNGNVFTATATLNRALQEGESIEWSFGGTIANTVATIQPSTNTDPKIKTATITIGENAQTASEQELTIQARVIQGNPAPFTAPQKIKIAATGSNPPATTAGLTDITATPETINLNSQNKTSTLSVSITDVNNVSDYSVDWSVNNVKATLPDTKTTTFGNDKKTQITLTAVAEGEVVVTATLKKDGVAVTPEVKKTTTITITSNPPSNTVSIASIKAGEETTAGENAYPLAKGGNVTLTAVPAENASLTGKTVKWSISGGETGTTLSATQGNTVTLTFGAAEDATAQSPVIVKAWVENDQAETNAASRNFIVAPETPTPVTGVTLNDVTVNTNGGTATVTTNSIVLGRAYDLSQATVSPNTAPRNIVWSVDEKSKVNGMNYNIVDNNKLTVTVDMTQKTQVTVPNSVTVVGTIENGAGTNSNFVAKFTIPITKLTTPEANNIIVVKDNTIVEANSTINLSSAAGSSPVTVKAFLQPKFEGKTLTVTSSDETKFKINDGTTPTLPEYNLTGVADGAATLTISVTDDANTKKEYAVQVGAGQPASFTTRQAAPRRMEAAPQTQTAVEKPYVIDITLPTQECEAGKNFDLSQAQLQAAGENNFNISWIVGRGYADMPDDTTVRMDRTGSVVMTAVVVGGKADGDVYTKDFEITFTEPKVEPVPVQKEEIPEVPVQKEEIPEVPVQKEEIPEVPVQKEEIPEVPIQKEEIPEVPVQKEEIPEVPVQKEEIPEVPVQKEETPIVPVQPEEIPAVPVQKEETPIVPVQPEETPAVPVQPEETPAIPVQKEEIPVVPVQKEEIPAVPVQPEETPAVPVQPEDKSIVISTKGELMTNNEIVLYAKNADGTGTNYQNAVWSIVKDDGTNSVIEKNVLTAKNTGTVVIKVTIGHGIPRIRTKVIEIAQ